MLFDAVGALAAEFRVFDAPTPRLDAIGRFLAFVPSEPSPALEHLAMGCVEQLDRFRAPSDAEELERRRCSGLTRR